MKKSRAALLLAFSTWLEEKKSVLSDQEKTILNELKEDLETEVSYIEEIKEAFNHTEELKKLNAELNTANKEHEEKTSELFRRFMPVPEIHISKEEEGTERNRIQG